MHSIHIRLSFLLLLMHVSAFATPIHVDRVLDARAHGFNITTSRRIYPDNQASRRGEILMLNERQDSGSGPGDSSASVVVSQTSSAAPFNGQIGTAGEPASSIGAGTGGQTGEPIVQLGEYGALGSGTFVVGDGIPNSSESPNSNDGSQGGSPDNANNGQRPGDSSSGNNDGSTNPNSGTRGNGDQSSGQPPNTGADTPSTGNNNGGSGSPPPNGANAPAPNTGNNNGNSSPPASNGSQPQNAPVPDTRNNNGDRSSPNGTQPQNAQPASDTGNDDANRAGNSSGPDNANNGNGAPGEGNGTTSSSAPNSQSDPNGATGGQGNDNVILSLKGGLGIITGEVVVTQNQ